MPPDVEQTPHELLNNLQNRCVRQCTVPAVIRYEYCCPMCPCQYYSTCTSYYTCIPGTSYCFAVGMRGDLIKHRHTEQYLVSAYGLFDTGCPVGQLYQTPAHGTVHFSANSLSAWFLNSAAKRNKRAANLGLPNFELAAG